MNSNNDVRDHVNQFLDIVDNFKYMEIKINDDLISIMLLYSLTNDFDNF